MNTKLNFVCSSSLLLLSLLYLSVAFLGPAGACPGLKRPRRFLDDEGGLLAGGSQNLEIEDEEPSARTIFQKVKQKFGQKQHDLKPGNLLPSISSFGYSGNSAIQQQQQVDAVLRVLKVLENFKAQAQLQSNTYFYPSAGSKPTNYYNYRAIYSLPVPGAGRIYPLSESHHHQSSDTRGNNLEPRFFPKLQLPNAIDTAQQKIGEALDGKKQQALNLVNKVKDSQAGLYNDIVDGAGAYVQSVSEAKDAVVQDLKDNKNSFASTVDHIRDEIAEGVDDLFFDEGEDHDEPRSSSSLADVEIGRSSPEALLPTKSRIGRILDVPKMIGDFLMSRMLPDSNKLASSVLSGLSGGIFKREVKQEPNFRAKRGAYPVPAQSLDTDTKSQPKIALEPFENIFKEPGRKLEAVGKAGGSQGAASSSSSADDGGTAALGNYEEVEQHIARPVGDPATGDPSLFN